MGRSVGSRSVGGRDFVIVQSVDEMNDVHVMT